MTPSSGDSLDGTDIVCHLVVVECVSSSSLVKIVVAALPVDEMLELTAAAIRSVDKIKAAVNKNGKLIDATAPIAISKKFDGLVRSGTKAHRELISGIAEMGEIDTKGAPSVIHCLGFATGLEILSPRSDSPEPEYVSSTDSTVDHLSSSPLLVSRLCALLGMAFVG